MKKFRNMYIVLIIALILSVILVYLFNDSTLKGIANVSSIMALVALLFKFIIDKVNETISFFYNKRMLAYELSMNSNIAYDIQKRYLEFCECYIENVYRITRALFTEGNSGKAFKYSAELNEIRQKHSLYIPEEVHLKLTDFEYVLRVLGAEADFQDQLKGLEENEHVRKESLRKTHILFSQLLNKNNKDSNKQVKYYEEIVNEIRRSTGVDNMFSFKNDVLKWESDLKNHEKNKV